MEHFVGIDVSLELSSLRARPVTGKVIREAKVASEPEALVAFLRGLDLVIGRVGLEARGPLSQWLYDGLHEAGLGPVLLETRHVKAALSAMAVKTDRRRSPWNCQLLAHGMVSAGPSQVGPLAGDPGAARRTQAVLDQSHRPRADRARATARVRPEGRRCEPGQAASAHPGARGRARDAGENR